MLLSDKIDLLSFIIDLCSFSYCLSFLLAPPLLTEEVDLVNFSALVIAASPSGKVEALVKAFD